MLIIHATPREPFGRLQFHEVDINGALVRAEEKENWYRFRDNESCSKRGIINGTITLLSWRVLHLRLNVWAKSDNWKNISPVHRPKETSSICPLIVYFSNRRKKNSFSRSASYPNKFFPASVLGLSVPRGSFFRSQISLEFCGEFCRQKAEETIKIWREWTAPLVFSCYRVDRVIILIESFSIPRVAFLRFAWILLHWLEHWVDYIDTGKFVGNISGGR